MFETRANMPDQLVTMQWPAMADPEKAILFGENPFYMLFLAARFFTRILLTEEGTNRNIVKFSLAISYGRHYNQKVVLKCGFYDNKRRNAQ